MLPSLSFLSDEEQLLIQSPFRRYTVNGPRIYFKPPFHSVIERREGISLSATQYVHIKNMMSGELHAVHGPCFFFLTAQETIVAQHTALPLARDEYIKILNKNTGEIKHIKGECTYRLEPHESYLGKPSKAVHVDEHTALVVRSLSTGALRLVTEHQCFSPSEDEEVTEVRSKILLEEHEVLVLQDKEGKYHYKSGAKDESAFFLPPYWAILEHHWASGLHKESRELHITRFDLRPKFMWYEFDVRTRDNVELTLKVTFFWQIENVEILVKTTDDASGDVCSHARSKIIQTISTVDFADFLADFNERIRNAVLDGADKFYSQRGIQIHSVEVREITCKEQRTQDILSEIIQETTSRINRIQKQTSENEVLMKKLEGESIAEQHQMQLLKMKSERLTQEARLEGEKQAQIISSFLEHLGDNISMPQKVKLFETLKKKEMMEAISGSKTHLFLTKEDIDLKIDVKTEN
jgi:regulator of protease activity HflC (stomatin/prohibitin superfamily)